MSPPAKPYQGHITNWTLSYYGKEVVVVGIYLASQREEHFIRTSPIHHLTANMVETENSIYTLGPMAKP